MDRRESPAAPPLQSPPPLQSQQPPPTMAAGPPNFYNPNLHNNMNAGVTAATTPSMITPNMQSQGFPFNSAVSSASKPMDTVSSQFGGGSQSSGGYSVEPAKKKRGRPRKYSPDGNTALGLATSPTPTHLTPNSAAMVVHGDTSGAAPSSETSAKRRGRPPGSGKKQLDALGSFGVGFTPHVILVEVGEDIASKVLAFSQQGPRTVCILSAHGAVGNVTLRQPSISGGTMTYEGRYEIISLSGSYLLSESNGSRSRTGGLSVSLAGPDGHVLGGGVAGGLRAASPVQVIVGSFIADGKKPKSGPSSAPPATNMLNFASPNPVESPPSQVHTSESSEENGNASFNRVSGLYNNNAPQPFRNVPVHPNMVWPNSTAQMLPQ